MMLLSVVIAPARQICLRNHTWDQKAIQSFSLPRVHHIPESLSQHKRPQREKRLNKARKETLISLCGFGRSARYTSARHTSPVYAAMSLYLKGCGAACIVQ